MSFSTGDGGSSSQIATSGDVALSNLIEADVLTYDSTTSKWENRPVPADGVGLGLPGGGTTGQVLAKSSNADGDAGWSTTISPSSPATISGAWNFTTAPTVNGSVIGNGGGGADTTLGNRIYVPATTATGYVLAGTSHPTTQFPAMKTNVNTVPIKFTRGVIGKFGFYINAIGSADCVVYCALWNAHPTLDRPGSLISSFSVANPAATSYNYVNSAITLSVGTTYWYSAWYVGTTAPTTGGILLAEHLVAQGNNDNNKWSSGSWRYTATTTPGDLTTTLPLTGDPAASVANIIFQIS